VSSSRLGSAYDGPGDGAPSLPPRVPVGRGHAKSDVAARDLMNDGDEEGMEGLKDWDVLKPG